MGSVLRFCKSKNKMSAPLLFQHVPEQQKGPPACRKTTWEHSSQGNSRLTLSPDSEFTFFLLLLNVCMYVCMYSYMYIYVCVCIWIYGLKIKSNLHTKINEIDAFVCVAQYKLERCEFTYIHRSPCILQLNLNSLYTKMRHYSNILQLAIQRSLDPPVRHLQRESLVHMAWLCAQYSVHGMCSKPRLLWSHMMQKYPLSIVPFLRLPTWYLGESTR